MQGEGLVADGSVGAGIVDVGGVVGSLVMEVVAGVVGESTAVAVEEHCGIAVAVVLAAGDAAGLAAGIVVVVVVLPA